MTAIAAVAVFALGTLLREAVSSDRETNSPAAEDITTAVEAAILERPHAAARAAREASRDEPSLAAELAMIDVAVDGTGIEQVVDTGRAPARAALALERLLVTAAADGAVAVWRRSDGAPLGEARSAVPLVALADADSPSLVLAALDRRGEVSLFDATDPARPRLLPLGAGLADGERPLAVAFSAEGTEIVAVGSGGEVLRVDELTGKVTERSFLRDAGGALPWSGSGPPLRLVVAKFVPEVYEQEEGLVLATSAGDVVGIDLADGSGETLVDGNTVPGRVLSVDRGDYGEAGLAVGATGGYVVAGESTFEGEPSDERGPPVPGIAIDEGGGLWRGGSGGLVPPEPSGPAGGAAVRTLSSGHHGIVAIHGGGLVSVLGPRGTGISMDEPEASAVASFDPLGRLVVAYGYDDNHVEELRAVRPQPRPPTETYPETDVLKTYEPDPDWWPQAEDPEALYVNDVAADGEHVIAAGQDPEGDAAVLVWDAESAEPLHHLRLGTGGIETSLPSIVSQVVPLPGKNAIAAYSAAQELIAFWSTESWELEDAVPVGPLADLALSPDEETLLAVRLGATEGGAETEEEARTLVFVDVDSASIADEVEFAGAGEAAFSPDGSTLAVAGEETNVEFRGADGREQVAPSVYLGDYAEDLAWRPDGALLAVALESGGVALIDPRSGEAAGALPHEPYVPSPRLSWSPDGKLLAAPRAEAEEEGDGYDAGPVDVWTLGAAALRRRMCELGGCAPPRPRPGGDEVPGDVAALDSVELVFRRDGELFAADGAGAVTWIAPGVEYGRPTPAFDWSEHGFAWAVPGQLSVLAADSQRVRSWPCPCSGVAWDGDEVVSLKQDGSALVRVDPRGGEPRLTPVAGLPRFWPALLGVVAGAPVAAAFSREPDRSTVSRLFRLEPDGTAVELPLNARGFLFEHSPSSSPDTLAFIAGASSGACYSTSRIGIVAATAEGELGVSFPPAPLGDELIVARSAQVAADGTVSVAVSRLGCDGEGVPEDEEPPLRRYVLEGGEWRPSGEEQGNDVEVAGEGIAVTALSDMRAGAGTLSYLTGSERLEIAPRVEGVVGRP